jgi:hypothetical protein
MTGQAERSSRSQGRHSGRSMTSVARQVRVHRRLVRGHDLCGAMAGGAVPIDGMVVSMAAGAVSGLRRGSEADWGLVAFHAGDLAVRLMGKVHLSRPQAMTKDRHLDSHRSWIGELGFVVAGGAVARSGTLMMADLTPAGGLKCQRLPPGAKIVASEAGESAMTLVGEGVAGGGRCCEATPRWIVPGRRVTPTPRSAGLNEARRLLKGFSRVERKRRAHASTPSPHLLVAAGAVARVYPRRVG